MSEEPRRAAAEAPVLLRLWIKPDHRQPMREVESLVAVAGRGLEGDAQFRAHRPVTLLAAPRWREVERELGGPVDPSLRRANLLLGGVVLAGSRGRLLRVGEVRFRIRGETKPCQLMEEQRPGLKDALRADWGGGAFAQVEQGGRLQVGDPVAWEE